MTFKRREFIKKFHIFKDKLEESGISNFWSSDTYNVINVNMAESYVAIRSSCLEPIPWDSGEV